MKRQLFLLVVTMIFCLTNFFVGEVCATDTRLYKIKFHTGKADGSGTDCNVSIKLYGTKSNSGWHKMNSLISGNAFECDNKDWAKITLDDHGSIWKIQVKRDNASPASANWKLDSVEVYSNDNYKITTTYFVWPGGRWFKDTKTVTKHCTVWPHPTPSDDITRQSHRIVYDPLIGDNLEFPHSASLDTTTVTSSKMSQSFSQEISDSNSTSVGTELGAESPFGSFKGSFKSEWNNSLKTTVGENVELTSTTTVNLTSIGTIPANSCMIRVIQYTYSGGQEAEMEALNSELKPIRFKVANFRKCSWGVPKSFLFGPSYNKVTWADWTENVEINNAIKKKLGAQGYLSFQKRMQRKGFLETPK